ncbi:MAG: 50S ribosomal protein L11 methyltransferase [Deltaproteobacteria bacterium]|nr:50S ribosomal protein L11 methyltransferase [Deltaproteobacteria bacterium]
MKVGRGENTLFIDSKEAFGDGSHPSTRLALLLLDELLCREKDRPDIVSEWSLDAGCGTGILALAAATLGGLKVFAVDIDPHAIEAAAENLKRNTRPGSMVCLAQGELSCARGPFGLVLANLAPSVHVRAKSVLWQAVAPGGWLILSGFFKIQKGMVLGFYVRQGATEEGCLLDEGWAASLLKRPVFPNPASAQAGRGVAGQKVSPGRC